MADDVPAAQATAERPQGHSLNPHGSPEAPSEDLASRSTLHAITGHLVVRLAGCGLGDAALRSWLTTQLLPQIEIFRAAGNAVRQADFDLSHNGLTDVGLASLLRAWGKTGAACPLLLKLHFNRLGDPGLVALAAFVQSYRGQVRELHLTNNLFSSHDAIFGLLESFDGLPQYPMWIRRQRRYAPVYLRAGHCQFAEPALLLQRAQSSMRLCLMEDGHCSKTLCRLAERGNSSSCPVAHLYGFLEQEAGPPEPPPERPTGPGDSAKPSAEPAAAAAASPQAPGTSVLAEPRSESAAAAAASTQAPGPPAPGASASSSSSVPAAAPAAPRQREGRSSYTCGVCSRSLPLDMFGRHQFRKAAAVDLPPGSSEDRSSSSTAAPAHLVRRCNDCVRQPCHACGEELPLSFFAKGQMMRPSGQRRCRSCAAETILCMRCGQPKPRSAFSALEVLKRKLLPRVCSECEQTNPYFERRYGLVLVFSSPKSRIGSGARVPRLPLDILRRIVGFSEPGDEFTQIFRKDFECSLCARSWSFATNDVERHVRHSQVHRQRLEKLQRGSLLRIGSLDLEPSRFRSGLGIRGAVCSRERVEEARALLRVEDAMAQGLAMEALRVAGLAPECAWVAPRVVEAAMRLQLGSAVPPKGSSAEVRSAQRRWKLFGHLGAEAEGHADAEEELSALNAMLSSE